MHLIAESGLLFRKIIKNRAQIQARPQFSGLSFQVQVLAGAINFSWQTGNTLPSKHEVTFLFDDGDEDDDEGYDANR